MDQGIKKINIKNILHILMKRYPDATCSLHYCSPFQLLIASILSAQCTDKRVNELTKTLFKKYSTVKSFAEVSRKQLEEDIHSTGFFRNKAKSIQEASRSIIEKFNGEVPSSMEALVTLSGVGRKTANVILGTAFGQKEGIVVDTHVSRLSNRLGLSVNKNPKKIEQDLMKLIPRERWTLFSHQLVQHGRLICLARSPKCDVCHLSFCCPFKKITTLKHRQISKARQ